LPPKEKRVKDMAGGRWKLKSERYQFTVNLFQQKTIRRRLKEVKIDKLKVVGDSR
jgi:hypothetical protein